METHKYTDGVQCDNQDCYACAKMKDCNRLDELDKQNEKKTRKQRETSRPIKDNLTKPNITEYKESLSESINQALTQHKENK